jgi:hypothetical protein
MYVYFDLVMARHDPMRAAAQSCLAAQGAGHEI